MNAKDKSTIVGLIGIAIAVVGFLLLEKWIPKGGLVFNVLRWNSEILGLAIPYRWLLIVAVGLILWAVFLRSKISK